MSEPHSKAHQKLINNTCARKNTTDSALHDLDRLLIAMLALVGVEDGRTGVEPGAQKDALETLLEYARREVADVEESLEEMWQVTSKLLFSEQPKSPTNAAEMLFGKQPESPTTATEKEES